MGTSSTTRRRTRGTGAAQILGDGRVRVWGSYIDRHGKRQRPSVIGKSRTDAERKLRRILGEVERGERLADDPRLGDYLTRWLEGERVRVKGSTYNGRVDHVRKHIVPAIGRVKLSRLTPSDVQRVTDGMIANGYSPRTASHVRATLRRALGDAQREGLVRQNVAALARPPRIPSSTVEAYTAEEARAIEAAAKGTAIEAIVILALHTGLRRAEIVALHADDISSGTLRVSHTVAEKAGGGWELTEPKTERSRRSIPLDDAALAAVEGRQGFIFGHLSPDAVTQAWRSLRTSAGLRPLPFHALRHTWASLALSAGVPIQVVAQVLGHSDVSVTFRHYVAHMPAQGREAVDAVAEILA